MFNGSFVVSEIKVRVNEREAKIFGVEELVNICPILALHFAGAWVALENLDFEKLELIRVIVTLERVVFVADTYKVINAKSLNLEAICIVEVLSAACIQY